ncbi:hypothetical protein [Rhodococcus erythropolis]|jgi:hypothetical protein|uniref:hypothetical protein n=1 Tax=Rhodococcus erythropolis TaxID=1833 RepID=UPI0022B578B8|nr:hypothetical protein [Rhodococcus erythropolis]MCZ4645065.1 hypothetical protein [Rhodococcus erythropolis]
MAQRAPKMPTFAGQGRAMQIEGSVAVLIAVAIAGGALAVAGPTNPIGFIFMTAGVVIALAGVYRVWRGTTFQVLEERIGPNLFD